MIVFGASGHGKVIIEILEACNEPLVEIWDDADKEPVWHYPVKRPVSGNGSIQDKMIISIGVNATRKKIADRFTNRIGFGTAIHPKTAISKRATIDEGTVVMANVTVNSDTKVGKHCILNTGCSIDHDCVIGDYAHISPNATLCGDVHIGAGTQIGAGATVIQCIRIGKWCTIGAGAVVVSDIPDYATAVGCPAKVIKINN